MKHVSTVWHICAAVRSARSVAGKSKAMVLKASSVSIPPVKVSLLAEVPTALVKVMAVGSRVLPITASVNVRVAAPLPMLTSNATSSGLVASRVMCMLTELKAKLD